MLRFTMTLDPDLYQLLEARARFNRRSMNGECVFLIECALAEEIDGNREILRTLMLAQGGAKSIPVPEGRLPEHIATDESLNGS